MNVKGKMIVFFHLSIMNQIQWQLSLELPLLVCLVQVWLLL
jgi:hypothetical protein